VEHEQVDADWRNFFEFIERVQVWRWRYDRTGQLVSRDVGYAPPSESMRGPDQASIRAPSAGPFAGPHQLTRRPEWMVRWRLVTPGAHDLAFPVSAAAVEHEPGGGLDRIRCVRRGRPDPLCARASSAAVSWGSRNGTGPKMSGVTRYIAGRRNSPQPE
jgi:hypothetical protein